MKQTALILLLSKVFHYVKTESMSIIWSKQEINYSKSFIRQWRKKTKQNESLNELVYTLRITTTSQR